MLGAQPQKPKTNKQKKKNQSFVVKQYRVQIPAEAHPFIFPSLSVYLFSTFLLELFSELASQVLWAWPKVINSNPDGDILFKLRSSIFNFLKIIYLVISHCTARGPSYTYVYTYFFLPLLCSILQTLAFTFLPKSPEQTTSTERKTFWARHRTSIFI